MKTAADVREEIENLGAIPTLPSVLTRLLAVIDKPGVSIKEISDFISRDQALSSRVLKMVNSPIYGFPGRISTVNQALMLIGLGALKGMLMGVAIFDAMQKTMAGLWEHSIGAATAGRLIAARTGYKEVEEASVAALIHDLGKVAFGIVYPDEYHELLGRVREESEAVAVVERRDMGVNHAEAGTWLARKWNFPRNLVEAVGYHHKPALAREAPALTAIVHLADVFVKMIGFGFSGDPFVPEVDGAAWERLGLADEDVSAVLAELEEAVSGESFQF